MPTVDVDTLDFNHSQGPEEETLGIGLTILVHPDVKRVGEVALVWRGEEDGRAQVHRTEPVFTQPGGREARPLAHPVISRQPVAITLSSKGVHIDVGSLQRRVQVSVGREPNASGWFAREDLARGILLDFSGCVLLMLHWMTTNPEGQTSRQSGIQGSSVAISALRAEVARVADSNTGVLIRGETGTGKELVARAIHRGSARRERPYLAVNMAAIPEATAASALFGHQRGAFTSALREHHGYFGEADGGTVFLDEIGETPKAVQGMLLRVLREGEVQPVGAAEPKKVDVRVLAATDAPLEDLVEGGRFSEALLRRLEAYTIWLPPLRERPDDVARLFASFLETEMVALGETKHFDPVAFDVRPWLPASFVSRLVRYRWPGNVAELQTLARRVAIANRGADNFRVDEWIEQRIEPRETPSELRLVAPRAPKSEKTDPSRVGDDQIAEVMRNCRFVVREAAEQLGVSRSWLHTRLEFCSALRQAKDLGSEEIQAALTRAQGSVRAAAEVLEVSEHGLKLRMKALGIGARASP